MLTPSTADLSLIEYRMRAVAIGHLALRYSSKWEEVPSIEILFDGKQVIEGRATAFTNGAIEAAIIHSRALLEFLGLGGNGKYKLKELANRQKDDSYIEKFGALTKLSVKDAVTSFLGSPSEAEAALAHVIYLANKGLAHTTSSFSVNDEGSRLLDIAFRGVPILVINSFYIPLSIVPPNYELQNRKKTAINHSK
jgi:hypothetical protein